MERKDQVTVAMSDTTHADDPAANDDAEPVPGPATLMSRLMRKELAGPPRGPVAEFLNQPWVIAGLFALCVGVIVWGIWFKPQAAPASAEPPPAVEKISEAERFYNQGRMYNRNGDPIAARRVWRSLVRSFGGVDSEQPWVDKANRELEKLKNLPADEDQLAPVREALKEARRLRDAGKVEEAEKIWAGFEDLYGNDSSGREILEEIRRDRHGK
jgi:hypothetical protein